MRTIKTDKISVAIDETTLTVVVRDLRTGIEWRMQNDGPGDIGMKGHAGPWQGMAFRSAASLSWEGNATTQRARLSHWPCRSNVWSPSDYAVDVVFHVHEDELQIQVSTINGRGEVSWIDGYYPRGFLFPKDTGGDLILPYGQGCMLRKDFPCELDHALPTYVGKGFVMPWWAHLADTGEGILAITDTPDDLCVRLATEHELGHTAHPYWQASLGNFRYARSMTYRFYAKADVNLLAKAYRKHAEARGLAVTLKEKAAARPMVDQFRGGMIVAIWIMSDFSQYPEWNTKQLQYYMTFDEALKRYQRLTRDAGIKKAFAHIEGWCRGGYDFNHPDCLPPDAKPGGWAGLKRLADGIHALGHGFMLHDQYADIYAHTASFKPENTVLDLSGVRPENREWLGGRQQWLCPNRTMPFARRNLTEVRDRIGPSGSFLDCHTISHLRECYDQAHLCSRADARKAWTEIFAMCQDFGWVTGSEGGADWSIPILDYAENIAIGLCPFDLQAALNRPLGDPIPLFNLVWHDCVVNQMSLREDSDDADAPLWTMLRAGMPTILPNSFMPDDIPDTPRQYGDKAEADFVHALKPITDLSEQVGFEEMTALEILDADRKVQRTAYADGTLVTVDFNEKTYAVTTSGKTTRGRFPYPLQQARLG